MTRGKHRAADRPDGELPAAEHPVGEHPTAAVSGSGSASATGGARAVSGHHGPAPSRGRAVAAPGGTVTNASGDVSAHNGAVANSGTMTFVTQGAGPRVVLAATLAVTAAACAVLYAAVAGRTPPDQAARTPAGAVSAPPSPGAPAPASAAPSATGSPATAPPVRSPGPTAGPSGVPAVTASGARWPFVVRRDIVVGPVAVGLDFDDPPGLGDQGHREAYDLVLQQLDDGTYFGMYDYRNRAGVLKLEVAFDKAARQDCESLGYGASAPPLARADVGQVTTWCIRTGGQRLGKVRLTQTGDRAFTMEATVWEAPYTG
ncbi:hypothetical protein KNE206_16250 [Kitasatospora sp. NE20-6]|uniref:hypothetical protein n=1 Tax=Kitasatospora sp. NE20-6 TaxID=2859066 RepID=UPI0034DBE22A